MTVLHAHEITFIAALIFAILEAVTGTFVLLGFASALVAVGAVEYASNTYEIRRDALVFAVSSLLAVTALRYLFARHGDVARHDGDINEY